MKKLSVLIMLIFLNISVSAVPNWSDIERLIKEQKPTQVSIELDKLLKQAKQDQNNKSWQQTLILNASIKSQTGEFENALIYLDQPWPQDDESQMLISLHKAALLKSYIQTSRWEIQNREEIVSEKAIPLKKKTMRQLLQDINQAFSKAYSLAVKQDRPLDDFTLPISTLKNYFSKPNYPSHIRGNIRDTITYLWVDLLADSSLWTPQQSSQANDFSLEELLAVSYTDNYGVLSDVHPVKLQHWLLSDLEHYFLLQNKPEAALEAYRVKVQQLLESLHSPDELKQLIAILKQRIDQTDKSLPWVNMLRSTLANLVQKTETDDANIKSVAILKQCLAEQSRQSKSSKNVTAICQDQLNRITTPSIQLTSMKADGLNKRSLLISHSNLDKVYFRAWRISLDQIVQNRPYQLMQSLVQNTQRKPDIQWHNTLPNKHDYKSHNTYIVPPLKQLGYWFIAASPDLTFSSKKEIVSTSLNLTQLVANIRTGGSIKTGNSIEVDVYNGETGTIINKALVELWSPVTEPAKLIDTKYTSSQGKVVFNDQAQNEFIVVVKKDNDFAVANQIYAYPRERDNDVPKDSLIFTDRAVYRPSQKILWKVVAYQGNKRTGKYKVFADNDGWVKLFDANHKLVRNIKVKTNQYGSVSGEFIAKAGRLLGSWHIETSWGGMQSLRVEEYKRPTFSVKINDSIEEIALDKPAKITGKAKYYFGQAISDGKVNWRIRRSSLPRWHYRGYGTPVEDSIIASGKSEVGADGSFSINFIPKSIAPKKLVTIKHSPAEYTFTIIADFTDSGGETRTATKTIRVAKVGIKANISTDLNFGIAGKPFNLDVFRGDSNNTPRGGNADWALFQIAQPDVPLMPADEPLAESEMPKSRFATKGDYLKPRWDVTAGYSSPKMLEETTKGWKDGKKIQQGTLQHGASGNARVVLKGLNAGLYRLRYSTKDQWGQVFKTYKDFIIAFKDKISVNVPAVLKLQSDNIEVGDKITFLAGSGFKQSPVLLEIFHGNDLLESSFQSGGIRQLEFPVSREHQGGLTFMLTMLKDYQLIQKQFFVKVPWSEKKLNVSFSTFRDKLQPGQKEKWRISVKNAKDQPLEKGLVEVLASMYDRSLDLIATRYNSNSVSDLYLQQRTDISRENNLGVGEGLYSHPNTIKDSAKPYHSAILKLIPQYQMMMPESAPGVLNTFSMPSRSHPNRPDGVDVHALQTKLKASAYYDGPADNIVGSRTRAALKRFMQRGSENDPVKVSDDPEQLSGIKSRTNFNETAFFYPHLVLEDNGSVAFEFEVPESLTEWKVWVSAISRDLRGGKITKFAKTSKELMVRPYLPRFLRAGDHAYIEVLVNNTSEKLLNGKLDFDILDATTLKSIASSFKLDNSIRDFSVEAGKSSRLRFSIVAPKELGMVAIRARASADKLGDGEQRAMPVLPSRIHLTQSRFAALQGNMSRELQFKELAQDNDPTRINDKLVVTVDGQLFYSTLNALPYLVKYPYECTEQTINRFLSTSIINTVFKDHPAIATMASQLAKRDSQFEKWEQIDNDPNRKMLLEETPWLNDAQGGKQSMEELIRILDPEVASTQSDKALLKLQKAQTVSGGFPWWEGGQPSVYMTAYLLNGFSRALEFNIDIPKSMVQKAWKYLDKEYKKYGKDNQKLENNIFNITYINYVLSSYPDPSWSANTFSQADRKAMLDLSFKHWQKHSGLLKAYLALTLKRAGRTQDAKLVFDSIMDSAKTDKDLGTYWAPEDRSWLWYNDRVDTHAFMLRAMMELDPIDKRRHGLVQWLMLNKKLNHWKSTRATAESIYSLVHYLKTENQLGQEERALIKIGNLLDKTVIFKPAEYTGKAQLVVEGNDIKPTMSNINIQNQGKSLMFASATWHFSTDKLPKNAQGDFFNVTRQFYRRVQKGKVWVLQPLQEGAQINIGDQLEVQLSLQAKHSAEFVHLRAPRGAGFEPMSQNSAYRWNTGIGYFEEIRDSGANYFFERLPAGEYSFKYRLRATTAGEFRIAPASVQSIYAPEFNAYSSGKRLSVK